MSGRRSGKAVLLALAALATLVLAAVIIGYALPSTHTASRTSTFAVPPEKLFAVLVDVDGYPAWRSGLDSVEVLARTPALRWREHGGEGPITFEMREARPPSTIVTVIADTSLPFGGRWTYVLSPEGSGTRLTITEDGEIYNPLFRFFARFVFGYTASLDQFLEDLNRHLTHRSATLEWRRAFVPAGSRITAAKRPVEGTGGVRQR